MGHEPHSVWQTAILRSKFKGPAPLSHTLSVRPSAKCFGGITDGRATPHRKVIPPRLDADAELNRLIIAAHKPARLSSSFTNYNRLGIVQFRGHERPRAGRIALATAWTRG